MNPPPSLLSRLSLGGTPTAAPVSTTNEDPILSSLSSKSMHSLDSNSARRTRGARKGEKDYSNSKKEGNSTGRGGGGSRKNSAVSSNAGGGGGGNGNGLIIEADGWIGVGSTRSSFSGNMNIPTAPLAMRLPQLATTNPFALPFGSSPNSYSSPPSSFTVPAPSTTSLSSSPLKFNHLPALSPTRVQGSPNKERDTTSSRWATTSPIAVAPTSAITTAPIVKQGFEVQGIESGMKALSTSPSKGSSIRNGPSQSRWATASDEIAIDDQEEIVPREKRNRGNERRASKKGRSPSVTAAVVSISAVLPNSNTIAIAQTIVQPTSSIPTVLTSLPLSSIQIPSTPPSTFTNLPPLSPSLRSPEPVHINWADDDDDLDALPELDDDWMVAEPSSTNNLPNFHTALSITPPAHSSIPSVASKTHRNYKGGSAIKVTPIFNPKILNRPPPISSSSSGPLSPTQSIHSTPSSLPSSNYNSNSNSNHPHTQSHSHSNSNSRTTPTSPRTTPAHLAMSSTARFGNSGSNSNSGGRGGGDPGGNSGGRGGFEGSSRGKGRGHHSGRGGGGRGTSSPAAANAVNGGGSTPGKGGPTPDSFARLSGMSFRGTRGGGRGRGGHSGHVGAGAGELVNGSGW